MRDVHGSSARARLFVFTLFVLAGFFVWRMGSAVPVAAQAKTKVNPKDGLTYVFVPPGTFQMGCSPGDAECGDEEKPAHSVTITQGFWIGRTPVTQQAFKKVLGPDPSRYKGDQFPVEWATWEDADTYCQSVDMRLPTEAEWEYAARGGNPAPRYGPLTEIAWYGDNSGSSAHEVGQKEANGYGLYDMLGNVWEWVADLSGSYDGASAVDPKGAPHGQSRVLRGGAWDYDGYSVRVSSRLIILPMDRNHSRFGFRCVAN